MATIGKDLYTRKATNANTKDFTFVTEKNKVGIVFRLFSSDIYDVSEGLSASIYDNVRRILNSINGEMKIFVVPLSQEKGTKPDVKEPEAAAAYNNMVNGLISRSVYHSVYIAIFGTTGSENSQPAWLEKSALSIISLLEASGFSARKTVTEGNRGEMRFRVEADPGEVINMG